MKEKALIKLERKIVIGMIIDTNFLAYLEPIIDIQSVQSNEARLLMTWIVAYFRKYKKAPSSKMQDIYEDHLDKGKIQDAQAEIIEEILQDLSDEVEDWDPEDVGYLQERSLEYINECKLRNLSESIDSSLDSGDLDDARQSAQEYKPTQVITVRAVEPLKSEEQIKAVFASRKKSLIHYPGTLGQILDPHMVKQGFVIYLAQNKGGKALRNDHSPVLTNKGWKDISQMEVGNTIYNKQGQERKVTGVFPQGENPCYRFTFNDGTFIDSDEEHIWTLQTYYQRYQKENRNKPNAQYQKWINMTTHEIVDKYGEGKILNGSQRPIFPRNGVVEFKETPLEIDPYVFGCLLGDGCFKGSRPAFTTNDECVITFIENAGYQLTHNGGYSYYFKVQPENIKINSHMDKNGRKVKGYIRSQEKKEKQFRIKTVLKEYGLWEKGSLDKFVPSQYLYNSKENRLALLQGLLDTDGDVDKRGHIAFNSISVYLAEAVVFLVRSLGGRATIKKRKSFYRGKQNQKIYGRISYRIFIKIYEKVFKIPRKVERLKPLKKTHERILHSIQKIGRHPTTCISTNDKDGLFITKDFIVTHNSFHLMDAGLRGAAQGKKVFIVQAGDMGQVEMERRIAIYSTMNSDQEKYCGVLYIPVVDCAHNQMGTCEMGCRIVPDQESPFEEEGSTFLENDVTFAALREAHTDFSRYQPCQECRRSKETIRNFKGAVWYIKRPRIEPLIKSSYIEKRSRENKKFYSPFHGFQNIRISTHSNESLSMSILDNELNILEDEEGFVPEIIVADYLDLFMPDPDTRHMTFRDQENKKWQRGRRLSQDRDALFISASQSDAEGFNKKLLDKTNFSEDRRKLDHVTAMLGINMTIQEKMMGVARLNEIVARETEGTGVVTILHRLQMGRPILGSYF